MWRALGYLLMAAVLGFLSFCAWFASVWGFHPLVLAPLYLLGLVICGGVILAIRASSSKGTAPEN